jgi:peptidoglycan/LPS O-acetylase OafA/YrhL
MKRQNLETTRMELNTFQHEPLLRHVMPELDTLRGLAIVMVVVYHGFYGYGVFRGLSHVERLFEDSTWIGRLGVNLFFVLSGFLITGLLLQSVDRPDYYRRFYIRRALRILPAYYAILLILAFIPESTWAFLGLSAIYFSNMTPVFGVVMSYPVLWSLAVEEHFYLAWPVIVRHVTPRFLALLSIAIILVSPLFRWISFLIEKQNGYVAYTFNNYTWNSIDGLACGAFLVLVLRERAWSRRILLLFSSFTIVGGAAFWLAGIPFGILHRQDTPIGAALQITPWNIAFTGTLGLFLLIGTSAWKSFVLQPAFRYLGRISYGLYLIQLLVFDAYDSIAHRFFPAIEGSLGTFSSTWIRFLCSACVAVAIAHLSREYFESRFLNLRDRFESPAASRSSPAITLPVDRDSGLDQGGAKTGSEAAGTS